MNYKTGFAVFFLFLSFYVFFSIGHFGGDGYEDYLTAESIVLGQGTAFIEKPDGKNALGYKVNAGIVGNDGKRYSSRAGIGVPALITPFYAFGHFAARFLVNIPHDFITMMAVSFFNPTVSTFNALLIFLISLRLGHGRSGAVAISLVYGLCTMAPVYSRTGFSEPTLILFLLTSALCILMYKDGQKLRFLFLAALAGACAMFARQQSFIYIPFFTLYGLWVICDSPLDRKSKYIAAVSFFLSLAVSSTLAFAYYKGYSDLFPGGTAYSVTDMKGHLLRGQHLVKGLFYYLVSPGKGFLYYNIPLALSIFAVRDIFRKKDKEMIFYLMFFLGVLFFYSNHFRRGSLFSWGPRYLLIAVPFMALVLGGYLSRSKGLAARILITLFSMAGFLAMAPCMLINQSKFYFFVKERLGQEEYLINFVPDLSPISGAWKMFMARVSYLLSGRDVPFMYDPDYWFAKPIIASMKDYNAFDAWSIKVLHFAPEYSYLVYVITGALAAIFLVSAFFVVIFCLTDRNAGKTLER
ncbi:MAG: hypothetical protein HQL30_02030 [Candidatus Omnitrophica bacterium]|nr:hypothetical protein [Candidatus Omnitrophota bacterium]